MKITTVEVAMAIATGRYKDPSVLSRRFHKPAQGRPVSETNISLFVPKEVYLSLELFYEGAQTLLQDLERVISDEDHQSILRQAHALGYNLPDAEYFKGELAFFKERVESVSWDGVRQHRDGYVKIPAETAANLNQMIDDTCTIVALTLDNCFSTDYMKLIKSCKQQGQPYQGPTALQSMVSVLISMGRVVNEMNVQIDNGRQKTDWQNLVPEARVAPAQYDALMV